MAKAAGENESWTLPIYICIVLAHSVLVFWQMKASFVLEGWGSIYSVSK